MFAVGLYCSLTAAVTQGGAREERGFATEYDRPPCNRQHVRGEVS